MFRRHPREGLRRSRCFTLLQLCDHKSVTTKKLGFKQKRNLEYQVDSPLSWFHSPPTATSQLSTRVLSCPHVRPALNRGSSCQRFQQPRLGTRKIPWIQAPTRGVANRASSHSPRTATPKIAFRYRPDTKPVRFSHPSWDCRIRSGTGCASLGASLSSNCDCAHNLM